MFKENVVKDETEMSTDEILKEAYEELKRISSDPKIIELYNKEKEQRRILNSILLNAEVNIKKEVAKNMLKENIDVSTIQKVTGLTEYFFNKLNQ